MTDQDNSQNTQERYSLVFSGRILDNFKVENVRQTLAKLLGLDEEKVASLFDGQTRVLKKNLGWKKACGYHKALTKIGAAVRVRVMMDGISLKNAIFPNTGSRIEKDTEPSDAPPSTEEKGRDSTVGDKKVSSINDQSPDTFKFGFECIRIVPAVFHPPHTEPVYTDAGKNIAYISSLKPAVGRSSAILAAACIGLFLEFKFVNFYAAVFGTGILGTLLSVLLLFLCAAFLPNLIALSRKARVSLKPDGSDALCFCRQTKKSNALKLYFSVSDKSGAEIARMSRKTISHVSTCENCKGELILKAEEEPSPDDIIREAAESIGDKLVKINAVEILDMINKWHGRNKVKKIYVIRDSNGTAIGHFALARFCVLTLYEDKIENLDRRIVYAFSMVLAGL